MASETSLPRGSVDASLNQLHPAGAGTQAARLLQDPRNRFHFGHERPVRTCSLPSQPRALWMAAIRLHSSHQQEREPQATALLLGKLPRAESCPDCWFGLRD